MPYYSDNLDDLLAIAGSQSFEGGQVSGITPNLIADNQATEIVNMTISPSGNLESRLGIESMSTNVSGGSSVQGMHYFDSPSIESLFVASNGTVFRSTASSTFSTTGGTVINQSAEVDFSQFNNRMYFTDGSSNLHFSNGTTTYRQGTSILSITVSTQGLGYTTAPAVTIGAPNIAYGTTASATATVTSGTISAVTVTFAGSGYTTAPTVTIAAPPAGGGHFTATATASISSLAPPALRLVRQFTNRIFAVGTGADRNTLYASDILDPEVWKATNSIIVGGDDGEDIVAIQPFYDYEILVFKPNKIYLVTADPTQTTAAGWTVRLLNDRIGCVSGRSVNFVNKDVFFLANDGIRSVARSIADDFYIVGTPISEPVKNIIARINRNYITACNAAFYNNRYFLAIPLDTAITTSHILVYNALFNAFEGLWSIPASRMTITNFSTGFATNAQKLAIGSPTSKVGHYLGYKDADSADATADYVDYVSTGSYTSSVTSKAYEFDDRIAQKFGSHYEIEFFNSGSTNASISMRRDTDGTTVGIASNVDTRSAGGITLPFTLQATLSAQTVKRVANSLRSYQKWRNMRMVISAPSKKLSVRGIMLAANPDTIEVQKNI
ncbi:MAG: hypothetical protein EBT26_01940 [Microbacteriaceae bacterium]|nr:hypothetical protein [Microbacteriaceae bacterium]